MRVLFVDDDPHFLAATKELLEAKGDDVIACATKEQASEVIQSQSDQLDIALFDMLIDRLRDAGLRLIRELVAQNPHVPIVVLTGYANLENAAESMEAGAFSYVPKERVDLLLPTLERAKQRRRAEEVSARRSELQRVLLHFWGCECYQRFLATLPEESRAPRDGVVRGPLHEMHTELEEQARLDVFSPDNTEECRLHELIASVPPTWHVSFDPPEIAQKTLRAYKGRLPDPTPVVDYLADVISAERAADIKRGVFAKCSLSGASVLVEIVLAKEVLLPGQLARVRELLEGGPVATFEEARFICYMLKLTEIAGTLSVQQHGNEVRVTLRLPIA